MIHIKLLTCNDKLKSDIYFSNLRNLALCVKNTAQNLRNYFFLGFITIGLFFLDHNSQYEAIILLFKKCIN